eukprot:TRINITY_DN2992_c0_g1_i3.p1 TRINITY_DN2992_c0_g1~~TRINITY_DN2992_c0_g1_i3.p1  ORF type:complete len:692 (+),score=131.29 TRINITY_DN2992_c0_g1_i3:210-2285(+)
MQFSFNIAIPLREEVTVWDRNSVLSLEKKHSLAFQYLVDIIDKMGNASGKAQGLPQNVTSYHKLLASDHKLYIFRENNTCIGILKVGPKKLFIRTELGTHKEILPLCVLDFYVHESCQRSGYGHVLFEEMLLREGLQAWNIGYDRPSPKFLGFLRKHYQLSSYVPQANNFVVFKRYFEEEYSNSRNGTLQHSTSIPINPIESIRTTPSRPRTEQSLVSVSQRPLTPASSHHRRKLSVDSSSGYNPNASNYSFADSSRVEAPSSVYRPESRLNGNGTHNNNTVSFGGTTSYNNSHNNTNNNNHYDDNLTPTSSRRSSVSSYAEPPNLHNNTGYNNSSSKPRPNSHSNTATQQVPQNDNTLMTTPSKQNTSRPPSPSRGLRYSHVPTNNFSTTSAPSKYSPSPLPSYKSSPKPTLSFAQLKPAPRTPASRLSTPFPSSTPQQQYSPPDSYTPNSNSPSSPPSPNSPISDPENSLYDDLNSNHSFNTNANGFTQRLGTSTLNKSKGLPSNLATLGAMNMDMMRPLKFERPITEPPHKPYDYKDPTVILPTREVHQPRPSPLGLEISSRRAQGSIGGLNLNDDVDVNLNEIHEEANSHYNNTSYQPTTPMRGYSTSNTTPQRVSMRAPSPFAARGRNPITGEPTDTYQLQDTRNGTNNSSSPSRPLSRTEMIQSIHSGHSSPVKPVRKIINPKDS